jgi:CRP/FNR family cyclic AMP-dependent transcriptional regulator
MEYLYWRPNDAPRTFCSGSDEFADNTPIESARDLYRNPAIAQGRLKRRDTSASWRWGLFCKSLSTQAMSEFESIVPPFWCVGDTVLLTEGERSSTVFFLLDGRVKLSMNSTGGRRLILGHAEPGDILGLASAVSGSPCEITAETQFPSRLMALPGQRFMNFLHCHPDAWQNVGRQLSLEFKRACDRLRNVGLTNTASTKLARLFLDWSVNGMPTNGGLSIQCSLTHAEIGECIGVARETVSRTLTEFKHRDLVELRGSHLVISSLRALEIYAGQLDS